MDNPEEKKLTPMLAQYRSIKSHYPDAVVLFRLGDFYEMFEADAKIGARELELALTGRSFAKGVRLAMAGAPHHHVHSYIAKLIERGYKVAVVEQLEDPRRVKKLVKRDVVRIITPRTAVEDALLHAKRDNYLALLVRAASARTSRSANDLLRSLESERGTMRGGRDAEDGEIVYGSSRTADPARLVDGMAPEILTSGLARVRAEVAEQNAEYRLGADAWCLVLAELTQIDVANLTRVQALNWLNDLQLRVKQMLVR
jgi:DNA mismatch repair protein MutS